AAADTTAAPAGQVAQPIGGDAKPAASTDADKPVQPAKSAAEDKPAEGKPADAKPGGAAVTSAPAAASPEAAPPAATAAAPAAPPHAAAASPPAAPRRPRAGCCNCRTAARTRQWQVRSHHRRQERSHANRGFLFEPQLRAIVDRRRQVQCARQGGDRLSAPCR